jgi:hypothetical protein
MDRDERLLRSFMEGDNDLECLPVVIHQHTNAIPNDEMAHRLMLETIRRDPEFRWLVKNHLGPNEAHDSYPEIYR